MNLINQILSQQAELPLLAAFVLGLLIAINPCQLAINMSALTYLAKAHKQEELSRAYILYALGKTITYTVLGWVLMSLIGGGRNISGIQNMLEKAELLVPYVLIAMGLFMLFRAIHPHVHHGDNCHNSGLLIHRNGPLGSLILGMILAFAFCPESAVFYFGLMLPLSITYYAGFLVPLIFGMSASIPVLILAWGIRKAIYKTDSISRTFMHAQQWINAISALIFFIMAICIMIDE